MKTKKHNYNHLVMLGFLLWLTCGALAWTKSHCLWIRLVSGLLFFMPLAIVLSHMLFGRPEKLQKLSDLYELFKKRKKHNHENTNN